MVIIITLVLAFILQLLLPWWTVAIAAAIPALVVSQSGWKSFQNGFIAIFLLWTSWSLVIYFQGGDILAERLATLFSLPSGWMTVVVSGLIGGLASGFGALTANRFKAWFRPLS